MSKLPDAAATQDPATPADASPSHDFERPPFIESASLFAGAHEIIIRHSGREYRLRRTRLDKLILTA